MKLLLKKLIKEIDGKIIHKIITIRAIKIYDKIKNKKIINPKILKSFFPFYYQVIHEKYQYLKLIINKLMENCKII